MSYPPGIKPAGYRLPPGARRDRDRARTAQGAMIDIAGGVDGITPTYEIPLEKRQRKLPLRKREQWQYPRRKDGTRRTGKYLRVVWRERHTNKFARRPEPGERAHALNLPGTRP